MYPSLIEIGSKTAEKNSAQTNKQTNRQTDRHYENNGHLAVNQYVKVRVGTDRRTDGRMEAYDGVALGVALPCWRVINNGKTLASFQ